MPTPLDSLINLLMPMGSPCCNTHISIKALLIYTQHIQYLDLLNKSRETRPTGYDKPIQTGFCGTALLCLDYNHYKAFWNIQKLNTYLITIVHWLNPCIISRSNLQHILDLVYLPKNTQLKLFLPFWQKLLQQKLKWVSPKCLSVRSENCDLETFN